MTPRAEGRRESPPARHPRACLSPTSRWWCRSCRQPRRHDPSILQGPEPAHKRRTDHQRTALANPRRRPNPARAWPAPRLNLTLPNSPAPPPPGGGSVHRRLSDAVDIDALGNEGSASDKRSPFEISDRASAERQTLVVQRPSGRLPFKMGRASMNRFTSSTLIGHRLTTCRPVRTPLRRISCSPHTSGECCRRESAQATS